MALPFKNFTRKDWGIWIASLIIVLLSNVFGPEYDFLIMAAALVGVTSLIFGAKGNVWCQILIVVFSILYGVISYRFHYWGEMVTYLGMTMPMGIWSAIVWFGNPSESSDSVVKIGEMNVRSWAIVLTSAGIVTAVFYFILKYFETPNIIFSTLSITTSFIAAALTLYRSSYFAVFYAMNDMVLIILWTLATLENPVYFPVIINFVIFLINDLYGFISWKGREENSN